MNIIKLRIRFITFCVCFLIVSIMALGNQVVFAKEINDNSIGKELDNNNGTQTEIYANYYHCDEEVFITGISDDLEIAEDEVDFGIDVTWDKDVQFVPIRGEMDYIWD